jgi:P2X purinoceptor 4
MSIDKEYRVLFKAYGLRFIINVSGTGGKFSVVPLMVTIGTGFGLMSLSVIIADCVMLNCTTLRSFYQRVKELKLEERGNDERKEEEDDAENEGEEEE